METVRRSYRGASCQGQAIVCCFHGVGADLVLIETLAPIDAYLVYATGYRQHPVFLFSLRCLLEDLCTSPRAEAGIKHGNVQHDGRACYDRGIPFFGNFVF